MTGNAAGRPQRSLHAFPRALAPLHKRVQSPTFDRRRRGGHVAAGKSARQRRGSAPHAPAPSVLALTAGMRAVRLQPNTKGAQMISRGLAASSKRNALSQLLVSATAAGGATAASAAAFSTRTPVHQSHVFATRSPRAALHSGSRPLRSSDVRAQVLSSPPLCGARDRASTQTCTHVHTYAHTCTYMHPYADTCTPVHTLAHTLAHTCSLSLSLSLSFSLSLALSLSRSLARSRARSLSLSQE